MTLIPFNNGRHISRKESALNALTQWANDCERKLLIGISCGVVLPRQRHREWAAKRIAGTKYLVRECGPSFLVLSPATDASPSASLAPASVEASSPALPTERAGMGSRL